MNELQTMEAEEIFLGNYHTNTHRRILIIYDSGNMGISHTFSLCWGSEVVNKCILWRIHTKKI